MIPRDPHWVSALALPVPLSYSDHHLVEDVEQYGACWATLPQASLWNPTLAIPSFAFDYVGRGFVKVLQGVQEVTLQGVSFQKLPQCWFRDPWVGLLQV